MIESLCSNCNVLFERKVARTFCSKACATSYRSNANDLNFMEDKSIDFKSYLIGMIYGDGCLSKQKEKSARITIALKDEALITYIKNRISPNRKVYSNKPKKPTHSVSYSVVNTNVKAIEDLIQMGLTPKKSNTITFPDLTDLKSSAFIRGYFDANGSVYHNTVSGIKYTHASFTTGSYDFALELKRILNSLGFPFTMFKDKRHEAYYLKLYSGKDLKDFSDYIYKNSEIHLSRKKVFFDDIVWTAWRHAEVGDKELLR